MKHEMIPKSDSQAGVHPQIGRSDSEFIKVTQ